MASDEQQLIEFGFDAERVKLALAATKNAGLQPAMDWLLEHAHESIDQITKAAAGRSASAAAGGDGEKDNNTDGEEREKGSVDSENATATCLKCNQCEKIFSTVDFAQLHATRTGHDDFSEATRTPMDAEERLRRLEELRGRLSEKRQRDAAAAAEEQRRNELIRRKAGKEAADTKQRMKEKMMEKALLENQRAKKEEQEARIRIKAQIEEDRRERQRREAEAKMAAATTGSTPLPPQATAPSPAAMATLPSGSTAASDAARIQIKLRDGSNVRFVLGSGATFQELLDKMVTERPELSGSVLMTRLPYRVYSDADKDETLQSLGLCPSSSLFVK